MFGQAVTILRGICLCKILGHCNIEDVKKLEHVVKGMHIRDQGTFNCEICALAKQSNQRNHEADTHATKPFELVHTDGKRWISLHNYFH